MIVLSGVSKIFAGKNGDIKAVENISLTVEKGQIYGIIGYSGAGKSTLIRLLNGLEAPSSGSIFIAGQDIANASSEALRQARLKVSMVFQHFNLLWSRTVAENIAFPMQIAGVNKRQIKQRVGELVKLVGLEGREGAYPSQLSGGQKQRVGIARALANNPEVLLCDEATSALDPQTTDAILDLLLDINRQLKLTIVLITHEMHVVRKICQRVAVMENGKIVEEGAVLDVFTHPQQPITQTFVRQVSHHGEGGSPFNPQWVQGLSGSILKLIFPGGQAQQPVVAEVIQHFNLALNILHGKITQTVDGSFGELYVHFEEASQLDNIVQYLNQKRVEIEVIQHA
ncbi:Methionine import ATP-binding protein MetN [Cedecea davisae]|uniref:Cell division ATP-binding protein FtsE n=1 Tax=Cedecea davisae DSM 4568 TaxID=566551 RepID=S3JWZ9_9ENTR|nr:methionine ABC transporter ATP-binding protein [Cedecea davisae]EPF17569.1 ABC transporter, ATP-binding protein [Cedecea davisae DSM 4568]SUX27859.1 Methionine import ATP-binding protein MetN [Cedecea davisae]